MKSIDIFSDLLAEGARRGLKDLKQIMACQAMAEQINHLNDATAADLMAFNQAWRHGMEVTQHTLVKGSDFREFYQTGWNSDWYHDDAEIQVEDWDGDWILDEEETYPLSKLGYSCWQGEDGNPHKSGEMFPIYMQFSTWAETRSSEPDVDRDLPTSP